MSTLERCVLDDEAGIQVPFLGIVGRDLLHLKLGQSALLSVATYTEYCRKEARNRGSGSSDLYILREKVWTSHQESDCVW